MSTTPYQELLASTDAFGTFGSEGIAELARRAVVRELKRGSIIYLPGDEGEAAFVIVEGVVRNALIGPKGEEFSLARMESPTVFGLLAVLDGLSRDARSVAATPVVLLEIRRHDVLSCLAAYPQGLDGLFSSMGRLVRRAGHLLENLAFMDARARLAERLLQLAQPGKAYELAWIDRRA